MDMPEHSRAQPGTRMLPPAEWLQHVPPDIARPLLALSKACNDIGTALAVARIEQARALDQLQRAEHHDGSGAAIELQTAESLLDAAQEYSEQLVNVYASTAARYVSAAVETASQAINHQPLAMPEPPDVVVTDILLLAEIHVPLIQLDPNAFTNPEQQHHAQVENTGIAQAHRLLQQAMAETIKPANLPEPHDPVRRFTLEPELAAALHEYAASCLIALCLAASRDQPE